MRNHLKNAFYGLNPSDPAWIYAEYRNYEPNLASHLETFSHDDGEVELYFTEFDVDAPVPAESRSSDPIIIPTRYLDKKI